MSNGRGVGSHLVIDADVQVLQDWSLRDDWRETRNRYRYLYPRTFPGGYQISFGSMAHTWTRELLGMASLNSGGTLCTVHHHMVMQKDVLRSLAEYVTARSNGTMTLLDKILDAQARKWWMSEYDLYITLPGTVSASTSPW